MATEVTLPQLGESVTEGTITAWLVEVGDQVDADQPLFELSSDKVDTEVPAPASGVLTEIKVGVDETVDVGTVVAVIGAAEEQGEQGEQGRPAEAAGTTEAPAAEEAEPREPAREEPAPAPAETEQPTERPAERPAQQPAAAAEPAAPNAPAEGDGERRLLSPIVRRMAAEHDIDVSSVEGSGQGGRVTREDIERVIAERQGGAPAAPAPEGQKPAPAEAEEAPAAARQAPAAGEREHVEKLSRVRQRIAERMMQSLQGSAQLTTVQEADVSAIMRLRERHKDAFRQREGVALSPFVFLCRAGLLAVRRHPTVNAEADWEAGTVTYRDYVNLGIAVDTEKGLLVPNVKRADDLTLPALARAIQEAADKARGVSKLEMQDIEGGTYTMTNTGSRGVLIDTPILNYPEVAILATGAIQKRPIVLEDENGPSLAIRDMVYLCLTYDHRLLDGADAARFVSDVKEVIEGHDWAAELGY